VYDYHLKSGIIESFVSQ